MLTPTIPSLINRVLLLAALLTALLICQSARAQDTVTLEPFGKDFESNLQAKLDASCQENNLPAMWAGKFSIDGQSVICASGVRKFGTQEKAEIGDIVHLGSCTKAMTAVVIGQLCSENKLKLDSPLKDIFSDIQQLTESSWGEVTVRQLLQHRSGAPANFDYTVLESKHPESLVQARHALLQKLISKRRPKNAAFSYSNVGFILLGHVVEKLEDKSWEEAITERLFKPLGMESAAFGPVGLPDSLPIGSPAIAGRAWGHAEPVSLVGLAQSLLGQSSATQLEPLQIDNPRCLGPAGRVHVNLQDWSKFVVQFAKPDGYRALNVSQDVWRELQVPAEDSKGNERYAGGWVIIDNPKLGSGVFHNGSNTTWYAYAFAVPTRNCCVLVATNVFSQAASRQCDTIARFMLQAE